MDFKKRTMKNNFGFLRLFFASLVIISHSPELVNGDRSRELLTSTFGTISFGMLAVDCFFLISGYLITQSFVNSKSLKHYLIKRCLRIYPGFVIAYLFSIFIAIAFSVNWAAFKPSLSGWILLLPQILILKSPTFNGVSWSGLPLNGSMWTIKFEFFCYLIVPLLFYLKLINRKFFVFLFLVPASIFIAFDPTIERFGILAIARLLSAFLIGSYFYIYKDKIVWNSYLTIVCIFGLVLSLTNQYLAEIGLFIFGGYLLFNFAFNFKSFSLNKIGSEIDLSYGVYLYAWPIQCLILHMTKNIDPWLLTLVTLAIVTPLAFLSFKFVEKPFMSLKGKFA